MKSMNTIQKLCGVLRVFARIAYYVAMVGAIISVVGIISFALIPNGLTFGNVTIRSLMGNTADYSAATCYTAAAVALILCVSEFFPAMYAVRYFDHELAAGTPFTIEGANELKLLGIRTIAFSLGGVIIASVFYGIMKAVFGDVAEVDFGRINSIGIGLAFLVASLLCRAAAEQRDTPND